VCQQIRFPQIGWPQVMATVQDSVCQEQLNSTHHQAMLLIL
jgi:hypothetical protein